MATLFRKEGTVLHRILMTGASAGYGKMIKEHLVARGHHVISVGIGGQSSGDVEQLDLAYPDEVWRTSPQIITDHGPFDTLINNAGRLVPERFVDTRMDEFQDHLNVNLLSPLILTQAFCKVAKHQPGIMRVINTASMVFRSPSRECVAYNASKAGLEAATRGLAREMSSQGIVFCCVAPAGVEDTQMQRTGLKWLQDARGMTLAEATKYQTGYPLGRMIRHEELCSIYQFAVEDMPVAMSGTTLTVPLASGI